MMEPYTSAEAGTYLIPKSWKKGASGKLTHTEALGEELEHEEGQPRKVKKVGATSFPVYYCPG